ncbi:MAG: MFS transporter [Thiotrichales bacterium]|nr:MFS transporter [Thiotrichales bacterium]
MLSNIVRSLHYRNYRNYLVGQFFSLNGTQIATVAQAWLVYNMTHSSLMLGLVNFTMLFPILLFGLFSGVLADSFSRKKLLFISQMGAMLLSFLLAGLALSDQLALWHIFIISFLIGTTQAIDMPVRQTFLADLVPKKMLTNAVGLNSTIFNTARFIGPAIAGVLLLQWQAGVLFAINGFSYLILLSILWKMKITPALQVGDPSARKKLINPLTSGLKYVVNHLKIRLLLLHVGAVSMMGTSFVVLMPVFVDQQYSGGSDTLGMLLSAGGAGSLLGALNLARKKSSAELAPLVGLTGLVGAAALILFSRNDSIFISLLILSVAGFSITTVIASTNAYIQQLVEDKMRGRVMSLFSMVFVGMAPIGSLGAGAIAEFWGVENALLVFAVLSGMISIFFINRVKSIGY